MLREGVFVDMQYGIHRSAALVQSFYRKGLGPVLALNKTARNLRKKKQPENYPWHLM